MSLQIACNFYFYKGPLKQYVDNLEYEAEANVPLETGEDAVSLNVHLTPPDCPTPNLNHLCTVYNKLQGHLYL